MFDEFSSGPTKKSYVATLTFSNVTMTDKRGKDKPRRNLLSRGKRTFAAASRSSASTVNTPSITSFFNNSEPSMLPCPLCGQLVPKFRINEHIDLQCKKFERVDSNVNSVSQGVEPHQSSPKRGPLKSTPVDIAEDDEGKETKTSPYFKNVHQVPQEIHSKSVVRAIDFGSLSSKLFRKYDRTTLGEDRCAQMCLGKAKESIDPLSSSQKENLPFQTLEEQDSVIDLTATSPEKQPAKLLCLETEHNIIPKLFSSFSKVIKRKKETTNIDHVDNLSKKAKNGGNEEPELSTEDTAKMHKDHVEAKLLPTNTCDSISSSDEEQETGTSVILGNLPAVSEADKLNTDHSAETSPQQLPYYLSNFRTILQAVLENDDDRALFNQDDMTIVHAFEKLSGMAQKLYVRLFQRKLKWLRVRKLDYEEICIDLGPVVQDLVRGGFLESDNDLQNLEEALELLSASEVKALAKTFHLGSSATQKQQLVDGLLRLSKQRSLFSQTAAQNNIGAVILKRAKQLASSCVRLCRGPRAVFSRVLLLFSLTDPMEDEEMGASGQSQLYTILLVKSGRLTFPDYTVERVAKVFLDRNDLIRYEASMRTLQEMISAMQTGQWEEALELYTNAKNAWEDLRSNHDFSHQKELPVFLRCFTTGWAYTRILSKGVEVLQRLHCYEKAVEELQSLLQQSIYCLDSRGRWWDRLALNLHQHLKKPEQAICAIRDGLSDPLVRTGHKLSLYQRAVRMRESASFKKYRLQLKELPSIDVKDVKHVTIRGQLFPHEGGMGKSRFLIQSNAKGEDRADATVICSVEELSLAHYRQQGFDQGIHGEGSTFSTLFALLLWDIIFMEGIPDVFRNPIQTCPLDFYTDYFYENRREALDSRIQLLNEASIETLNDMMEETWNSQRGKECSCINWDRFPSLKLAQSLVSCMGGAFLAGVIARMAKDYRHCRGGLPDLVVWNTSNNSYKLVEVKGPNDRLSQKQQIWLDELQRLGADVEVCHVVATGAIGSHLE